MHQSQSTSSIATNVATSIQTATNSTSTTPTLSTSAEQKNSTLVCLGIYYEQKKYSEAYDLTQILLQCSQ